jgi:hypothetical protein
LGTGTGATVTNNPKRPFANSLILLGTPIFAQKMYDTPARPRLTQLWAAAILMDGCQPEWMNTDAGWKRAPIKISVPFHGRATIPGPKEYIVGDSYHRSLVSAIREKPSQPQDNRHFHHEPFELSSQPNVANSDVECVVNSTHHPHSWMPTVSCWGTWLPKGHCRYDVLS